MISLADLLEDKVVEEEENATKVAFSIEELEKTASHITMISEPDRDIDKMAKIAVLLDLGIDKESSMRLLRRSERAARKSIELEKKRQNIINLERQAERIRKSNDLIESGKKIPSGEKAKNIALLAAGAVGGGIVGAEAMSSKKTELKNVARRHY
jgi:tetrahydromethanopterin S-methyltransferase subunit F